MTLAPSGTVTFLFTDIEGSTQRWDRNRSAMADAVRLHDQILRSFGILVLHPLQDNSAGKCRLREALPASVGFQRQTLVSSGF